MRETLAERLLRDRAERRARERERLAALPRQRAHKIDVFEEALWTRVVAGADPGYVPQTPMRPGKDGFWIACRGCGKKFDTKGMAYCEACLALPAEERRALKPNGRQCEAPDCTNILAATARIDARYCSHACRERAHRDKSRHENDTP